MKLTRSQIRTLKEASDIHLKYSEPFGRMLFDGDYEVLLLRKIHNKIVKKAYRRGVKDGQELMKSNIKAYNLKPHNFKPPTP